MIVHFTCSRKSVLTDIERLRAILKIITQEKHELAREWIEDAHAQMLNKHRRNISAVYQRSMEEVAKADVMIAEVSSSSFGVGYQVANAIQQKKPILLLSREDVDNDSLVRGLDNAVVTYSEYNDSNLEDIIKGFLRDNDIKAKDLRFNFFLDRQVYNYLRWASFKTGKTKAKILRELVLKEINKNQDFH